MKKLADSLRIYARMLGLSDAEIARRSRLSETRYGHYVRGRSEPDMATLLRICKVLNATPNDLLLGGDEKKHLSVKNIKKDEAQIFRNRIAAGVKQLEKRQLLMVSKLIDGLLDSADE